MLSVGRVGRVGGCTMNEDWEQVTPFLQDMQHCAEEDYFNPQEVSENIKSVQTLRKLLLPFCDAAADKHCRQALYLSLERRDH